MPLRCFPRATAFTPHTHAHTRCPHRTTHLPFRRISCAHRTLLPHAAHPRTRTRLPRPAHAPHLLRCLRARTAPPTAYARYNTCWPTRTHCAHTLPTYRQHGITHRANRLSISLNMTPSRFRHTLLPFAVTASFASAAFRCEPRRAHGMRTSLQHFTA